MSLAKRGLDYLADLWSGRVHNTLIALHEQLALVQQGNNTMTQNEQRIMEAAAIISSAALTLGANIDSLGVKIAELQSQAQSPETHEVEDLTQEFDALSAATNNLVSLSSRMSESVPAEGEAETSPVDVGTPSTPVPDEPTAPAHIEDPVPPGATVAPQGSVPVEVEVEESEAEPVADEDDDDETVSDPDGDDFEYDFEVVDEEGPTSVSESTVEASEVGSGVTPIPAETSVPSMDETDVPVPMTEHPDGTFS